MVGLFQHLCHSSENVSCFFLFCVCVCHFFCRRHTLFSRPVPRYCRLTTMLRWCKTTVSFDRSFARHTTVYCEKRQKQVTCGPFLPFTGFIIGSPVSSVCVRCCCPQRPAADILSNQTPLSKRLLFHNETWSYTIIMTLFWFRRCRRTRTHSSLTNLWCMLASVTDCPVPTLYHFHPSCRWSDGLCPSL